MSSGDDGREDVDREGAGDECGDGRPSTDPNGRDVDPRVRVRGIYATALTELLSGEFAVVRASEPIRARFDARFPTREQDADVTPAGDRQGVGVVGRPDAVAAVTERLRGVSRDTLAWVDDAPRGAVFEGVVTDTFGSGAVVDLGESDGFLPFDATEDYVEEGDVLRVQVVDPEPPWGDDRPELATDLRVEGGLVALHRSARGGGSTSGVGETARLAELLPVDPPEGWTPRWEAAADDADMDALAEALRLFDGAATRWVWFGPEARFALAYRRRAATTTMPGHHRIKAAAESASTAVDFAEAVCEAPGGRSGGSSEGDFPFGAVTRQFGPREGDRVAIGHGKPDGRLVVLGRGEVTALEDDGTVTIRREMSPGGTYDALGVKRRAGDVAVTKLREGRWWYATVYRGEGGERRGTYVNVCTPVEVFPAAVRYVDLHVDVVKHPDDTVERVDDDELDEAVAAGNVPAELAEKARAVATRVEDALDGDG